MKTRFHRRNMKPFLNNQPYFLPSNLGRIEYRDCGGVSPRNPLARLENFSAALIEKHFQQVLKFCTTGNQSLKVLYSFLKIPWNSSNCMPTKQRAPCTFVIEDSNILFSFVYQLFGKIQLDPNKQINEFNNFRTFGNSLQVLFRWVNYYFPRTMDDSAKRGG